MPMFYLNEHENQEPSNAQIRQKWIINVREDIHKTEYKTDTKQQNKGFGFCKDTQKFWTFIVLIKKNREYWNKLNT